MAEDRAQHDDAVRSFLSRRKVGRKTLSLPLTPMIDVTFQLLLYFLLTTTFRAPEQQLMGTLPSAGGEQSILLPIHVTIEPAGKSNEAALYRINEEETTPDAEKVYAALAARARSVADPGVPVVIHANEAVRWAYVIEVFNAASSAGFAAVTFAPTRPPT